MSQQHSDRLIVLSLWLMAAGLCFSLAMAIWLD